MAESVMLLTAPLLAFSFALIAPLSASYNSSAYWTWILVSSSLLSAAVSLGVGRAVLRIARRLGAGLVPYLSPLIAIRDWFLVGALFTMLYYLTILTAKRFGVPWLGLDADTTGRWVFSRGLVIFAEAALVIWVASRARLVSANSLIRKSLYSDSPETFRALAIYGFLFAVSQYHFGQWIFVYLGSPAPQAVVASAAEPVSSRPSLARKMIRTDSEHGRPEYGSIWIERLPWRNDILANPAGFFIGSAVIFSLSALASTALQGSARRLGGRYVAQRPLPISATIALVGPTKVGKTILLTRAYDLMLKKAASVAGQSRVYLEETPQSIQALKDKRADLNERRIWPLGTVATAMIPYSVRDLDKVYAQFNWMDLPGGIFVNPDEWKTQVEEFEAFLPLCDAVTFLLDAKDLDHYGLDDYPRVEIFYQFARSLYQRLRPMGIGARPVPLAVIITKADTLPETASYRLRYAAKPIAEYWKSLARDAGLRVPATAVYCTAAVMATENNALPALGLPLRSRNAVEPVYWLTSQIMLSNMSTLDKIAGFHGRSPLLEAAMLFKEWSHPSSL